MEGGGGGGELLKSIFEGLIGGANVKEIGGVKRKPDLREGPLFVRRWSHKELCNIYWPANSFRSERGEEKPLFSVSSMSESRFQKKKRTPRTNEKVQRGKRWRQPLIRSDEKFCTHRLVRKWVRGPGKSWDAIGRRKKKNPQKIGNSLPKRAQSNPTGTS